MRASGLTCVLAAVSNGAGAWVAHVPARPLLAPRTLQAPRALAAPPSDDLVPANDDDDVVPLKDAVKIRPLEDMVPIPVFLTIAIWGWPWVSDLALAAASRYLPMPTLLVQPLAAARAQLAILKLVASRLLVATACGALIGLERKDADRPAGLRSMTLVSVGSALYTLACGAAGPVGISGGDPVRAAAQVCTGVGFIGAGVIAKGSWRDPVRGVTTACAVWVSAALGVVSAAGMWPFAFYATGVSITVLRISRWYNSLLSTRLAGVIGLPEAGYPGIGVP